MRMKRQAVIKVKEAKSSRKMFGTKKEIGTKKNQQRK